MRKFLNKNVTYQNRSNLGNRLHVILLKRRYFEVFPLVVTKDHVNKVHFLGNSAKDFKSKKTIQFEYIQKAM